MPSEGGTFSKEESNDSIVDAITNQNQINMILKRNSSSKSYIAMEKFHSSIVEPMK